MGKLLAFNRELEAELHRGDRRDPRRGAAGVGEV